MSGVGVKPVWRQCADLALAGAPPAEIAVAVGTSRACVYAHLHKARRRGVAIPRFSTARGPAGQAVPHRPRVSVSPGVLDALDAPAAARGLTPRELAAQVLAAVAHGGLVDAVLDDLGDA